MSGELEVVKDGEGVTSITVEGASAGAMLNETWQATQSWLEEQEKGI